MTREEWDADPVSIGTHGVVSLLLSRLCSYLCCDMSTSRATTYPCSTVRPYVVYIESQGERWFEKWREKGWESVQELEPRIATNLLSETRCASKFVRALLTGEILVRLWENNERFRVKVRKIHC